MIAQWKTALEQNSHEGIKEEIASLKENIPLLQNMLENFKVEYEEEICGNCSAAKNQECMDTSV
jgi:hypothetical protein